MSSLGRLLVYYNAVLMIQESYEKAIQVITNYGIPLCKNSQDFLA